MSLMCGHAGVEIDIRRGNLELRYVRQLPGNRELNPLPSVDVAHVMAQATAMCKRAERKRWSMNLSLEALNEGGWISAA